MKADLDNALAALRDAEERLLACIRMEAIRHPSPDWDLHSLIGYAAGRASEAATLVVAAQRMERERELRKATPCP